MAKQQGSKKAVYPEIVYGSRPDGNTEKWQVEAGQATRGEAWTNFAEHKISIPLADDETAKVVRGHELIHTKISPSNTKALEAFSTTFGIPADVISASEEIRVNAVLGKTGYDTDLLIDGSEKESGKRVAQSGTTEAYDSMIKFGAGLIGTKAFRQFINGVRSVNKDWAKDLRSMEVEVNKMVRRNFGSVQYLANERPMNFSADDGRHELSTGFAYFTQAVGEVINSYIKGEDYVEYGASGVEFDTGKSGFAKLRINNAVKPDKQVKGHLARRKKAAPTGKRIAYPSRLLTDPEKRIFSQKPRNNGGVVLLDLSGSMDLSIEQVEAMVDRAPGAWVAGYSHKRNTSLPNLTILADRGKRVSSLNGVTMGSGNCIDGPALDFTIGKRRGSEPIIWVCDGMITDKTDRRYDEGAKVCAEMVKRHKVIVVPTVDEALKILANPRGARSKAFGNLGMFLPRSLGGQEGKYIRA
jgi:hypothetical protein